MFDSIASASDASRFDEKVRYGAHTDYQGFTILRPDKSDWHVKNVAVTPGESRELNLAVQCGGLEVFCRQTGEWIQVCIPEHLNALVVNAGNA